jgi:hypothetical protein
MLTCVYSLKFGRTCFELIIWRNLWHPVHCETREPNYWYLGSPLEPISYATIYYISNFVSAFWEGSLIFDPGLLTCLCLSGLVLLHSRNLFWCSNCFPLYNQPCIFTSDTCSGFHVVVISFTYSLYYPLSEFHTNILSTLNITNPCNVIVYYLF